MLPCLITHTSLLATNADATRRNHVTSDNLVCRYVNNCINFWQYLKWPHVDIKTALVVSLLFSSSVCVHVSTVPLSKKTDIHFQTAAQLWRFSLFPSFLPPSHSCVFLSSLYVLPPPLLSPPSLLDWWSKHRKRAGSVPPRQSWGWAFLQSSCAGVKSLLWFSFHLSSANHRAILPRLNSDPCKEFHSKDGLTPVSQLHPLPSLIFPLTTPFPFFQLASFMCWQSIGEKDSRNEVRGETESRRRAVVFNSRSHTLLENF